MVPGSNPLHATELFQEGLIIPPVKFMVGGDLNKPVADMIKANVRIPEVVFGDLGAQSAALQVGKRRLLELCEKYGAGTLTRVMDYLIEVTRERVRQAVLEMPDGAYEFDDFMDADGIASGQPVTIACKMTHCGEAKTLYRKRGVW